MLEQPLHAEQRVVFCNTGLEASETLDFVAECSERWRIPITWLEYRTGQRFEVVTHETAARDGRPFSELIADRGFLPNPRMRFCTSELKVRTVERWAAQFAEYADGFDSVVGIRADEPARVARMRARAGTNREGGLGDPVLPLATLGVAAADVQAFWGNQPFGLRLASHGAKTFSGNCVLCFMKPHAQVQSLIRARPEAAEWWIAAESRFGAGSAATFRNDRPRYSELAKGNRVADMFGFEDTAPACFCGDDA